MALLAVFVHLTNFDRVGTVKQGEATVKQIPLHISDWSGTDHPLDEQVFDILETKAILHRSYTNSQGRKIFLSLVYYEETKVDFHAPEGCLGGRGIITTKSPATVTVVSSTTTTAPLTVNQLVQKNERDTTLVYYFYKTGNFIGRNYIWLRLNLIFNKFKNTRKSGSLIRVSTLLTESDDGGQSRIELEQFINDLYPYLVAYI